MHKHKWKIAKTTWPFSEGYGVFCPKCKTIADTGLKLWDAEERRDVLNGKDVRNREKGWLSWLRRILLR